MAITVGNSTVDADTLEGNPASYFATQDDLGGSGSLIGDVAPLHVNDTNGLHINAAGEHWLKTGTISSNLVTYPNAKSTEVTGGGVYTGTSFSIGSQDGTARGMCWDGTNYWVTGDTSDLVYKYESDGTYSGQSINHGLGSIIDIIWDGTHFWLLRFNQTMNQYDSSWVATGFTFNVTAVAPNPHGITWDGTHFWAISKTNNIVYKFDSSGVYTSESFSVTSEVSDARGITWDGTSFYVLDGSSSSSTVYKYNDSGVYSGVSFSATTEDATPYGFTYDGTHLWIIGIANDYAYAYTGYAPFVGIETAEIGSSTGLPIYVRIK